MNTKAYGEFVSNMENIKQRAQENDTYINNLLFANLVTGYVVYLQTVFEDLLRKDKNLFEKLTESSKYKNNKIPISKAYKVDMEEHLIAMVKNVVFHNLSDVEPLFKDVLQVSIKYNKDEKILKSIDKRHDIVHRNGKTKAGETIEISKSELESTIKRFDDLTKDVDSQIITKHGGN